MKPHFLHPDAGDEIEAAVAYYEEKQPGLGVRFRGELEATMVELCKNPYLGAEYTRPPYRFFTMKNFNYVIYFADEPNRLYVVAVAHGRQRPNYWAKRRRNGT